jgi:hypothetical protein
MKETNENLYFAEGIHKKRRVGRKKRKAEGAKDRARCENRVDPSSIVEGTKMSSLPFAPAPLLKPRFNVRANFSGESSFEIREKERGRERGRERESERSLDTTKTLPSKTRLTSCLFISFSLHLNSSEKKRKKKKDKKKKDSGHALFKVKFSYTDHCINSNGFSTHT